MPYQSFPDRPGSSQSNEKWNALNIKKLDGLDVLDLGCNEGYFVAKAIEVGARSAIGVDRDSSIIEAARNRYPHVNFINEEWDSFLKKQASASFDIVIMLSALHYAPKPTEILKEIRRILRHDGIFVLEASISDGSGSFSTGVTRGTEPHTDTVWHPTDLRLADLLKNDFVHRYVAPSVLQPGDPISRHIYYAFPRHPVALLISGFSGSGKTALADALKPACVAYKLDEYLRHVIDFDLTSLGNMCRENFEPGRLDILYHKIVESDKVDEFVTGFMKSVDVNNYFIIEGFGLSIQIIKYALVEQLKKDHVKLIDINLDNGDFIDSLSRIH